MAFFRASKSLSLAMMLALATACGGEDDPAPEGDDTDDVPAENDDEGGSMRADGGARMDASRPPAERPDASTPTPRPALLPIPFS